MKKMIHNFSRKITFTSKLLSLAMSMLLFMVAGIQQVNAQCNLASSYTTTYPATRNGVTVNVSFSGGNANMLGTAGLIPDACIVYNYPSNMAWTGNTTASSITFTFSSPVNNLNLLMVAFGVSSNLAVSETVTLTTNGGTPTLAVQSGFCTGGVVSSNTYTANYLNAHSLLNVSAPSAFTTLTISQASAPSTGGGIFASVCLSSVVATPCLAGTTAPTLSATTKANVCPATTVDLTTITASNTPASTSLTWHTGTPATTANKVATPSAVAAGTYYAAFFDATNNCYSGTSGSATTAVTATVSSCAPATCTGGVTIPSTVNGVSITGTGTGSVTATFSNMNSCSVASPPGYPSPGSALMLGQTGAFSYTYTFSVPVNNLRFNINGTGEAGNENFIFTTNAGVTPSIINDGSCYTTITGNQIISGAGSPVGTLGGGGNFTISSTNNFTTLTISGSGGFSGSLVSLCANSVVAPACNAGTTAPTLSATTKANVCPATTVDLTTITASNTPASTSLTWHTGTPATTANKVATPSAVAAGTYYAAFFDATNNCYSGTSGSATTAVTATVATCTTPVTVGTPAVITGTTGTTVTGNPPTGVSGGTSPYTYSDGTGDALCTAPVGPTLALPTGRIIGLVGSTGAHSINTTGLGEGTYQYCIKVCDSTGTNCAISKHTIVVTAACNAGSAAPSLIKN